MPKPQKLFDDVFFESKNGYLKAANLEGFGMEYVETLKTRTAVYFQQLLVDCELEIGKDKLRDDVIVGHHLPAADTLSEIALEWDCKEQLKVFGQMMVEYRLAEQFFGGKDGRLFGNTKYSATHAHQAFEWMKFLQVVDSIRHESEPESTHVVHKVASADSTDSVTTELEEDVPGLEVQNPDQGKKSSVAKGGGRKPLKKKSGGGSAKPRSPRPTTPSTEVMSVAEFDAHLDEEQRTLYEEDLKLFTRQFDIEFSKFEHTATEKVNALLGNIDTSIFLNTFRIVANHIAINAFNRSRGIEVLELPEEVGERRGKVTKAIRNFTLDRLVYQEKKQFAFEGEEETFSFKEVFAYICQQFWWRPYYGGQLNDLAGGGDGFEQLVEKMLEKINALLKLNEENKWVALTILDHHMNLLGVASTLNKWSLDNSAEYLALEYAFGFLYRLDDALISLPGYSKNEDSLIEREEEKFEGLGKECLNYVIAPFHNNAIGSKKPVDELTAEQLAKFEVLKDKLLNPESF